MTDLKFLLFTLQDFCRCTQRLAKNVLLFCIKKCESLFLFFSPRVVDVVKQFSNDVSASPGGCEEILKVLGWRVV